MLLSHVVETRNRFVKECTVFVFIVCIYFSVSINSDGNTKTTNAEMKKKMQFILQNYLLYFKQKLNNTFLNFSNNNIQHSF